MTTEELIANAIRTSAEKLAEALNATAAVGGGDPNRKVYDRPLIVGDVVKFRVPASGYACDLYGLNSDGIKYDYLTDVSGRKISVKSLIGRKNNGIDVSGDTRKERLINFIRLIDEKTVWKEVNEIPTVETYGEISLRVKDIKIIPSINPEWSGQRLFIWEMN